MAKKSSVKKVVPVPKKTVAKKAPRAAATIDYPREGEAVRPGHYAVRATAQGFSQAQLRINGGEWLECREAVGHFWLDWAPVSGAATLELRARSGKGRWTAPVARGCVVSAS